MTNEIPTPADYLKNWERSEIDVRFIGGIIAKYSPGGAILDLGCGPTLTSWAQFHPKITRLAGTDRNPDNIRFIEEMIGKRQMPSVFDLWRKLAFALNPACPSADDIFRAYEIVILEDVRNILPQFYGQFDAVTQIGCFACLPTDTEIKQAMSHVAKYLKQGGIFMNVMWRAAEGYIEDAIWGGTERTKTRTPIDIDDLKGSLAKDGLQPIFEQIVTPCDDPERYQSFYCGVFRLGQP